MKIVHLATSLGGGAGIAARRIAEAQQENSMDVSLIALNGDPDIVKKHEKIIPTNSLFSNTSKALTLLQSSLVQRDLRLTTPLSMSKDLLEIRELKNADIVHIHAFYNLASVRKIISLSSSKNLFVTLHDERFFTGACHYSFDCKGFQNNCLDCPQVRRPFKSLPGLILQRTVQEMDNERSIGFITPSRWLAELAMSSTLLANRALAVLPNPIPEKFTAKKIKTNNENRIKLGFISENLNNPYKGLRLLIEALSKVDNPEKFELHLFGRGKVSEIPENMKISIKSFADASGSVEAYQSCDIIVVPSLQDNSPSVISESLMCGVPVLGSDTGGIPEVLQEFGMPIFKNGNLDSLIAILERLVIAPISESDQEKIKQRFAYQSSANAHNQLYRSAMRRKV